MPSWQWITSWLSDLSAVYESLLSWTPVVCKISHNALVWFVCECRASFYQGNPGSSSSENRPEAGGATRSQVRSVVMASFKFMSWLKNKWWQLKDTVGYRYLYSFTCWLKEFVTIIFYFLVDCLEKLIFLLVYCLNVIHCLRLNYRDNM